MSNENEPAAHEASQPSLARELEAIPYEPLLPIEKKLIACCLVLGVLLLGLLLWASATFFPVGGPAAKKLSRCGSSREGEAPTVPALALRSQGRSPSRIDFPRSPRSDDRVARASRPSDIHGSFS